FQMSVDRFREGIADGRENHVLVGLQCLVGSARTASTATDEAYLERIAVRAGEEISGQNGWSGEHAADGGRGLEKLAAGGDWVFVYHSRNFDQCCWLSKGRQERWNHSNPPTFGGVGRTSGNIQHPTPNIEHRTSNARSSWIHWLLGVRCWMLDVFAL